MKRRITILSLLIGGISILAASSSMAAPHTGFFGPLIATLSNRVAALNNQTDKVSVAEKKEIVKDLALLDKTSTSEATDLKNAITIAKGLTKTTPDYTITFQPIMKNIFIGFYNDASNLVTSVQNTIGALPESSCKTKAQATLNLAVVALPALSSTDFTTFSKAWTTAMKDSLKANTLALSSTCTGGGSGGSDTLAMTVDGTPWAASNGSVGAGYGSSTHELDFGGQEGNTSSLALVLMGITGTGTFSNSVYGSYTVFNASTYSIDNAGTVTITTFDTAHHTIAGTFSFSATSGSSIVTVTQGSFNIKDPSIQ